MSNSIPQSSISPSNKARRQHEHRGYAIRYDGTRWVIEDLVWGDEPWELHRFKSLKRAKEFLDGSIADGDVPDRSNA